MPAMTGGDAIVQSLLAHDVDTVFGLPGVQLYGLFDAMQRAQPRLKVIGARHEQACSYMAFGYARSTGRVGVFSVVPGPGVLNAGAGMLTAYGANTPTLCVTGQVPSDFLGLGRGHLHEMPDQLATLRGFTKWAQRMDHPARAPLVIAQAWQEMLSGRPGPAAVEMPWDVFLQRADVDAVPVGAPRPPPVLDDAQLDAAAKLLQDARAPMIFVGSGALHAGAEVLQLAELLDAPVVAFRSGRGIVSNAHELGLTIAAAWPLWPSTDLVIGIGSRLEVPGWRWPRDASARRTLVIDIDPAQPQRAAASAAVTGDAAQAVAALLARMRRTPRAANRARRDAIRAAAARAEGEIQAIQPQFAYLRTLREVLPDDGIVTDEISQVGFASWYAYPVYAPRTFIASGYQGTLGSGFPTALGVKVAHPRRAVVAICGDGGFMFAVQELATAVQYGIALVTLVFNNDSYGNVRRDQQQQFDGRVLGADLVNPDFVALARAFGLDAERVAAPRDLRAALERALASERPRLIEVRVPRGAEADPWRFIHPAP